MSSGENKPPDSDFLHILESPFFWRSKEIVFFIIKLASEWKDRVKLKHKHKAGYYVSVDDDIAHGLVVLQGKEIKEALVEWYDAMACGLKIQIRQKKLNKHKTVDTSKLSILEETGESKKLSETLRFLRNFFLHAPENLTKNVFQTIFGKNPEDDTKFLQGLYDKLPGFVMYIWCEKKNLLPNIKHKDSINKYQVLNLKSALNEYSKENLLCTITMTSGKDVIFSITKASNKIFTRLNGTVAKVFTVEVAKKNEMGTETKAILEVRREDEIIKHWLDPDKKPIPYNLYFGAENMLNHNANRNFVFVEDVQAVIKHLDKFCPSREYKFQIQPTDQMQLQVISNGKFDIYGTIVPLSTIKKKACQNIISSFKYSEWRQMLMGEPVRLFRSKILSPEEGNSKFTDKILDSPSRVHNLVNNTSEARTKAINAVHYELAMSDYLTLFVKINDEISKSEPNASQHNLKDKIVKYLCTTDTERKVAEIMLADEFTRAFIFIDGVDKLSEDAGQSLVSLFNDTSKIQFVITSQEQCTRFSKHAVNKIKVKF